MRPGRGQHDDGDGVVPRRLFDPEFVGPWKARVVKADKLGRLQVVIPDLSGRQAHASWAWPRSAPMGGGKTDGKAWGSLFLPPEGAWVWVEFENGDPQHPVWGPGWFAKEEAPEILTKHLPNRRGWVTPGQHHLFMDDDPGGDADANRVEIGHARGHVIRLSKDDTFEVVMQGGAQRLLIEKGGDKITLKGGTLQLDGVTLVGVGADAHMVRGEDLKTWLLDHTHGSAVGPTGPPIEPWDNGILSADHKVK